MSEKSIKYFGAHYCPYSNESSRAYNLIYNLFREKYPEVNVTIFWSEDISEENKHEFIKSKADYVPTITNGKYAHIKLSIPENYDKENKTSDEITEAILNHIYDQLDNEPTHEIAQEEPPDNSKKVEDFTNVLNEENEDTNNTNWINNNYVVGSIFILVILFIIILPFYKKYKNKTNN